MDCESAINIYKNIMESFVLYPKLILCRVVCHMQNSSTCDVADTSEIVTPIKDMFKLTRTLILFCCNGFVCFMLHVCYLICSVLLVKSRL